MKAVAPLALILSMALGLAGTPSAHASIRVPPPPPPPPPPCRSCQPPPPPTPVPTLAPTVVAPTQVVSVQLAPTHVRRGKSAKVQVMAASGSAVLLTVHYRGAKPTVYHGKIGGSGTFVKSWRVPTSVTPGKTLLQISVDTSPEPYSTHLWLVVTR